VDIWRQAGERYEFVSFYPHPDEAWVFEVTALDRRGYLAILIPDATPDADFTPMDESHAYVRWDDGTLPWTVVRRLADRGRHSMRPARPPVAVRGDVRSRANTWRYGEREFVYRQFHFAAHRAWCHEIAELHVPDNDFIDVKIPDRQPGPGPFVPATADRANVYCHGEAALPWLVFLRFLAVVAASGHIVGTRVGG